MLIRLHEMSAAADNVVHFAWPKRMVKDFEAGCVGLKSIVKAFSREYPDQVFSEKFAIRCYRERFETL